MISSRLASAALVVGAVLALFLFLGSRGLNEPDEGRYAEIAREMAGGGDWLVPHLNGIPHFQKPPVLYWATASAFRVFGVNEWAARLPSALAALGTLLLTCWIGTQLFDRKTGIVAALILLSTLEFFGTARLLTPDMLMTFWITAAIACLVERGLRGGRVWGWLFFVAMGLGFLTKGPMAFVVPLSAALSWQWARRRAGMPFRLPWLGGVPLMLALGLSWFVILSVHDHQLFRYFAGYELVQRFASKSHGRSQPFWYFAGVLPAGLFPWTFFIFAMLGRAVQRWRLGWRPAPHLALLFGWVAIPLVILSLSGSKLPTYVLPLFPALALALARWTRTEMERRAWNGAWMATAGLLAVIAAGLPLADGNLPLPLPHPWLLWPALVGAFLLFGRAPESSRTALAVGTVALWLTCAQALPRLNDYFAQQATVASLAARVRQAADCDRSTIFTCEARAHGWEFYLQRLTHITKADADIVLPLTAEQNARMIKSAKDCPAAMLAKAPAYGLVRQERFARSFPSEQWAVLGRAGDFLLIGTRDTALAQP